jgi:hypothetical protein
VRLLETIRDDEDVKVTKLLNLIRSNAPPNVADERQRSRRRICPDNGQVENEDNSSEHDTDEPRPRRNVMAIRSLCDTP